MATLKTQGAVDIGVCTDNKLEAEEVAEGDTCNSKAGVDDGLLLIDYGEFADKL